MKQIDDQSLSVIRRIAKRLAPKYTFGFYEVADLEQEAIIFGMKSLEKYDQSLPLENFMVVCMGNALKNFKRKHYVRLGADESKYAAKKNLAEPLSLESVDERDESSMWNLSDNLDSLHIKDIFLLIDQHLPRELRADYLRMKHGTSIPKARREKVEEALLELLEEHGYDRP